MDITTLVTLVLINTSVDSVILLIAWRTQTRWPGLGSLALGYASLTVGFALLAASATVTSAPLVVVANLLIVAAMALVPDGLAVFLDVPRRRAAGALCLAFAAVFWPLAMALAPENASIRIIVHSALQIVMFAHMVQSVALNRTQPRALRWALGAFMLIHIAFTGLRGADAARRLDQIDIFNGGPMEALFFFEFNLILTFLFLSLLLMIGFRLTDNLRQRNAALADELDQRRRLQAELATALRTEVALRQEQRQFVSLISHEFRTPLAVIDRATEMVLMLLPQAPQSVTDRLSGVREAVARLVRMIDQLLAFERLDHGAMQREPLDLGEVFAAVSRYVDGLGVAGRVSFILPARPLALQADREMLISIVSNLVDNGLKYSPADTTVTAEARVDDDAVTVEVQDRGVGIPADEIHAVASRFFRASTARHVSGTGLGLSTVKRLVELHGGRFELSSTPGRGTRVAVSLPLADMPAAPANRQAAPEPVP